MTEQRGEQMHKKIHSGIMLTLLLIGMLTLAFNIQGARADWTWTETIYIRADGSVDPDTAPISTIDNVTYTLTDNIVNAAPSDYAIAIIIERNNTVLNGAGYTLQGTQAYDSKGISLEGRSNVTIKNIDIRNFYFGVCLYWSSNNTVSGNTITNNYHGIELSGPSNYNSVSGNTITNSYYGIELSGSSNNSMSGNTITNNYYGIALWYSSNHNSMTGNNITSNDYGIVLWYSSNHNSVSGNTITNSYYGIALWESSNNSVSGNTIANNADGIWLGYSSNNRFWHNNFIDNARQVHIHYYPSTNVWDEGYPSGGNYWSDYEDRYPDAGEIDDSGIWDTPYEIDEDNQDNYPLMEPYSLLPRTIDELKTEIEELGSDGEIDNQGIGTSLLAKLNVAQMLIDDGKTDQAQNILNAFISEVQAQSGKHITPEAADILIESAEYILSHL